jgi:hypothetical protein
MDGGWKWMSGLRKEENEWTEELRGRVEEV